MIRRSGVIVAMLAVVAVGTAAVAQRSSGDKSTTAATNATPSNNAPATGRKKVGNPMAITPAREAAAVTFARLYHPELAGLLDGLKKRNKRAYRQAIRQLYLDSERLGRIKDSNPKRYELALQIWKLDSRIRLLAARVVLVKNPDPKLEEQLRKAIGERVDLRLRQMQLDRDRTVNRLKKLDANIADLQEHRDRAVEQQLTRVKRSLGIRPGKVRKGKAKRRKANARKTVTVKEKTSR